MKAAELANLLMQIPTADVRIESPLVGVAPPILEPNNISMNNEANSWIIELPPIPITQPYRVPTTTL